jgi:hypothetical protein
MDGHNNLKFEWHNRNLNSEDMSNHGRIDNSYTYYGDKLVLGILST